MDQLAWKKAPRLGWITDPAHRRRFAREVLEALPDWFGQPDSLEEYVREAADLALVGAWEDDGTPVGFFSLKIHHGTTGDLSVLGTKPAWHRTGLGRRLWTEAELWFRARGCTRVVVKTLDAAAASEPYDRSRAFYRALGFEPLITLPELWDPRNPCLLMVKDLR